jgi:hypothetical protein
MRVMQWHASRGLKRTLVDGVNFVQTLKGRNPFLLTFTNHELLPHTHTAEWTEGPSPNIVFATWGEPTVGTLLV